MKLWISVMDYRAAECQRLSLSVPENLVFLTFAAGCFENLGKSNTNFRHFFEVTARAQGCCIGLTHIKYVRCYSRLITSL